MTILAGTKAVPGTVTGLAEVLVGRAVRNVLAVADASGKATETLEAPVSQSATVYRVYESIKIFSDSSTIPVITLYERAVEPQNFVGGSDRGDLNEWTENPELFTTEQMILQWSGADVGANCYARIQYREVTLLSVSV